MKVFILIMSICTSDGCLTTPLETYSTPDKCWNEFTEATIFASDIIEALRAESEDAWSLIDCMEYNINIA